MAQGQVITSPATKILGEGSPDGTNIESSATGAGGVPNRFAIFGNPVQQRSNPMQAMIQGFALGDVTSYNANAGAPANATTISTNEVTVNSFKGVLVGDMVVGVSKAAAQVGMGFAGFRVSANDTIGITLCNPTAANVVPTANETYVATVVRGLNTISANLGVIPVVLPNSTLDVTFTLAGSNATGSCAVNSAGQLINPTVLTGGAGYVVPPTVIFTPAAGDQGYGATAESIVAGGAVVGVAMTNAGFNYRTAPVMSFIGGNAISPGMIAQINKPTAQAGLGIGNVRVVDNNKVALTYFNDTAANITPTANETYVVGAWNEMPAITPVVSINANIANATAAAANTSNQTGVTIPGISALDTFLSTNPSALQSPLLFAGGFCAANTVNFQYSGGVPGGTPANGAYNFQIQRRNCPAPVSLFAVTLTPTAVANNTTAEQIFALPTNATLQASSCVVVNKPSYTPGIGVVGARANSSSTVGITFINVTASNITPPAETYIIANFPATVPSLSANQISGSCTQQAGITFNQLIDLQNELQQTLQVMGAIKGA